MIRVAYGVEAGKVGGGPSRLERDRFDVIAKAPTNTPPATVRLMLQSLLADRFNLVVHTDTKPAPAWALTVGKGKPKLKPGSGEGGCESKSTAANSLASTVFCRNTSMEEFAEWVRMVLRFRQDLPVVDRTGLKGSWNFDFKLTGFNFVDAIEEQLGLKIEQQNLPQPVILVDSANEKPTGNAPGVTERLPPPARFEVASIRPSSPDPPPGGRQLFEPGGRVNMGGSLKFLITLAWGLDPEEAITGAPKWLDSPYFAIVAKAPAALNGPAVNDPQAYTDVLRPMLRALLVDRFKLATHYEDRPVDAYTLSATNPKLAKADPSNRTGCKLAPAPDGGWQMTCRNITMAQFAEGFPTMTSLRSNYPVLDATGIDGAWDFVLTYRNFNVGSQGPGGGGLGGDVPPVPAGGVPEESDPSGGLTFIEALNKQLGLKLEVRKRPLPVLVIDHIEEKPRDN